MEQEFTSGSTNETNESNAVSVLINGHYAAPPVDEDGKQWVRTAALVLRPQQELYTLWRDTENAPLWQEQIASVQITGLTTSHWVMAVGKDDENLEWDSEILNDEPGKRISWRSIDGESSNAGEVVFEADPGGHGTVVTVLQEFRMSKFASAWETLTGRNPKQAVIENLRHFKALAETGEIPRTQGQPHGPRGIAGGAKKSLYGENVITPNGTARVAS